MEPIHIIVVLNIAAIVFAAGVAYSKLRDIKTNALAIEHIEKQLDALIIVVTALCAGTNPHPRQDLINKLKEATK